MLQQIGKFQIVRQIGQGAMGEVYLALDPHLARTVAVKTIRPSTSFGEEAKARFEREAQAAGAMNHPNVAMVFEFGEDEGTRYLAMEFVEGGDLEAQIRSGQMSQAELLELVAQACDGLAYAHGRDVVHRDIKPANILISFTGKRPLAKLVDFGVALIGQSTLTQKGEWMGTVNYMAPEYLDTGTAVPASDLFAMGVILYEVLTGGRRPFAGEVVTSVLNAILRQPPAPFTPEELRNLNPAIVAVVHRSLAKAPEDRYPSAEALAAAIREAVAGSGLTGSGRPDPVPGRVPAPAKAATSQERVIVVGKGGQGQCMSLRVALRQASDGMQIQVLPGVYRESLVVDKEVIITGQGERGAVIIESPKGLCLALNAPQLRLENLTLRGQASEPVLEVAQGRLHLHDCDLEAEGGAGVLLRGIGLEANLHGCSIQGSGPVAFLVGPNGSARMQDCLIEGGFLAGLDLESGARIQVQHSRILNDQGIGLRLAPGAQASLDDCQVSGQPAGGLELEADSRAELRRCRIEQSGSVGVLALERATAILEECRLSGHALAAVHGVAGASVQLRACNVLENDGLGASLVGKGLLTLEACALSGNQESALLLAGGGTVQMKACKLFDGMSFGVVCASGGRGVLEDCEIYGNAKTGAKVEPGGSLLLVRCDLHDGRDTGILLFEDADVTLEECVVHRNARGGILLSKDASDPILRGGNKIQDALRVGGQGAVVRVAPVK
jgi:tRNA A-37 threonylcarbamoyl transferase component Bud32